MFIHLHVHNVNLLYSPLASLPPSLPLAAPPPLSLFLSSYQSEDNVKVKKELSDEVRHIYADKYSQHIIESEFEA